MYDAPPFFPSAETRLPPSSSSSSSSSPSLSNLSPSIIITLMVLSVAIIVTTCLCLLFRHLHRLPLPRCLLHRHLSTSSSSSSSSPPLRASAPPPQDGAAVVHDESFIDSLPLFSFSSVTRRSSSAADGDCAVCLCKFKPHDLLRLLPLCCHAFHAECIDTWLQANRTCPLCRSNVHACEADLEALLQSSARIHAGGDVGGGGGGRRSFRLEIGSVSRRRSSVDGGEAEARRSYSIGSFDYVVDADSEVAVAGDRHRRSVSDKDDGAAHLAAAIAMDASLAADVASGRSWLGDYMDRLSATLSSRTASFRSSRRFFSGSSRRSDASAAGFVSDWDLEASRVGEEISELFRWASGV
ncbi:E3 ubiquitin-protein ligase ATL4 [Eucalyptus grandis]|uniref:E3 ubiquitin-protein ligase ATL4 n=1 Tax=Eucalyptus grandis TaxID=71139 RepID=UPI00192EDC06|nr:E3 ubiquitin-protein ligase ATL4 [Eucalyptus grandis]